MLRIELFNKQRVYIITLNVRRVSALFLTEYDIVTHKD